MPSSEATSEPRQGLRECAAHLFALTGLAVSQPLYDLFGKYADFFIAHDAQPQDILLLVLLLSAGLPLLLIAIVWIAGWFHRSARLGIHLAFFAVLATLTVGPIVKQIEPLPGLVTAIGSSAIGLGLIYPYYRFDGFRKLVTYVALLALVFPLRFLGFSTVSDLVFPEDAPTSIFQVSQKADVVFVIFEEIPLVSLMDEDRQIDAIRYPSFASLADDAHWFRNYTVNGPMTKWSVPSILTGRYTREQQSLLAKNYPESLFTLLGASHRIKPHGFSKKICPKGLIDHTVRPPFRQRLQAMARDMSVVYLHMTLPDDMTGDLPPVTDNWTGFVADTETAEDKPRAGKKIRGEINIFIDTIKPSAAPNLFYLHTMLAHNPWKTFPSGRAYPGPMPGYRRDKAYVAEAAGYGGKRWTDNPWLVIQGQQRHLLAVGTADWGLGKILKHLKAIDLYDRSLIVVTSDHGCSFEPGSRNRGHLGTVAADTMPVPLIIKLPHQQQGVVHDDNVESIDILPTIADALDIDLPWPVDGRSAFDDSTLPRAKKTLYFAPNDGELKKHTFDADNPAKYASLEKKLAIFGSGKKTPDGHFTIGPYGHIVGQSTADLPREPTADFAIDFRQAGHYDNLNLRRRRALPCYFSGSIRSQGSVGEPVHLAISVNGQIRAVTQTYREPTRENPQFYAIIPEDALRHGKNDIDFFAIHPGDGLQPRLTLVALAE